MNYVILGAGPAGVIAAETIATADPGGYVTLVGGEPGEPYARMAIPYVLTGKIAADGTRLRKGEGHYAGLGIDVVHGRATGVDPGAGEVALEDGRKLPYDKLLVATGSSPVKPPVAGLDLDGVHHCWTLEDAAAIAQRAKQGADVVLMGAGFIGCIILESLVERGVNLTVVEAEDRMIPNMMDAAGGRILAGWVADKGVNLLTSAKVTEIARDGGRLKVSTDRGGDIAADLVVVATGVKPNVDFLAGSGVQVEHGIVVDDHLQSSVAGIYAAGDVAQGPDFGGGFQVHAIQPTAADHGRIAALNMLGQDARYQGSLIMNVLDTLGLVTASFGDWQGDGDVAEHLDEAARRYIKLVFDGDVLVGALSIGRTDQIGVLRGLIQSRVALGPWKASLKADPSQTAAAYVARTRL